MCRLLYTQDNALVWDSDLSVPSAPYKGIYNVSWYWIIFMLSEEDKGGAQPRRVASGNCDSIAFACYRDSNPVCIISWSTEIMVEKQRQEREING